MKTSLNETIMAGVQPQQELRTATKAGPSGIALPDYTAAGDEYTLSDLDMVSPDTLVTFILVYELGPEHDFQLISESLHYGMAQAAEKLPQLAAKIHFDRSKKPLKRMTPGFLNFQERKFKLGEHKSYTQLAESSFLPSDFDRLRLLPEEAYADTNEKPLFIAQLNLIPGGLILALGFNHVATDAGGMSLATAMICECSKASMEASPVPRFNLNYQCDNFAAPTELLALPREQLITRIENYQIIETASTTNHAQSSEKNGMVDVNKRLIYRIEGSAVQRLKDSCKPSNGAKYVSTYDCVIGMLWMSVLRIRVELKPHLKTSESRLLHPVDLRNRSGEKVSRNYFGNAVTVASAGPVQIADLLGPNGLSFAASSIRQSIENTTLASIANVTALGTMMGPTEKLLFRPSGGLLEQNLMVTTWYSNKTETYDFGVGPPSTARTWAAPVPGFAILFPDCKRRKDSRVYDLYVTLSGAEQDMLSNDKYVRRWFQVLPHFARTGGGDGKPSVGEGGSVS